MAGVGVDRHAAGGQREAERFRAAPRDRVDERPLRVGRHEGQREQHATDVDAKAFPALRELRDVRAQRRFHVGRILLGDDAPVQPERDAIRNDVRVDAAFDQADDERRMRDAGHARADRRVRRAERIEAGQDAVRGLQRVDAALRLGRVARTSAHVDFEMQAAVVRRRDRVGEARADREVGVRHALREQPRRAEGAADLLVVGEMQLDGAIERRAERRRMQQRAQRKRVRGEIGFRHGDAASVHDAVAHDRRVRIHRPVLAGRHDVAVRVERDRRAAAAAEVRAHDQVRARRHAVRRSLFGGHRVALDVKSHRFEQRSGARGVRRAVAGRIVGRLPDEFGQKRLGVVAMQREPVANRRGIRGGCLRVHSSPRAVTGGGIAACASRRRRACLPSGPRARTSRGTRGARRRGRRSTTTRTRG